MDQGELDTIGAPPGGVMDPAIRAPHRHRWLPPPWTDGVLGILNPSGAKPEATVLVAYFVDF